MADNLVEFPYSCPNDAAIEVASDEYKQTLLLKSDSDAE